MGLGPNQLKWLRDHLIYNGVHIFAVMEATRTTRIVK